MKSHTPNSFLNECSYQGRGSIFEGFRSGLTPKHLDGSNPGFNKLIQEMFKHYEIMQELEHEVLENLDDEGCC